KGDGVAADAKRAPFFGDGFSQADHAHFAGGVVDLADVAVQARGRGDVDDAAGFDGFAGFFFFFGGLAHVGGGGADEAEGGGGVDVEDLLPLFVARFVQHAVPGKASVVDEDVEFAVGLHGRGQQMGRKIGVG